ncbi:hypothetical protein H4S00_006556, partial [Coemansia sp. D1744]
SVMTTLSNWEEEGMVEDILVKIGYLDHYVPELTSSLIKWHVENLQWRKDLKEAALLTDPTNQVPLVLDTQPSPQADRAGPAAPAADAPALPKEPEDVEMTGDTTAKPSFAAVVVHTPQSPGPSK